MDDDKFLSEYTSAVIKGWAGFKLGYAKNMLLLGDLTPEQEESELNFSPENVEVLMKNSADFDSLGDRASRRFRKFYQEQVAWALAQITRFYSR